MIENRQKICSMLLRTLRETDRGSDIVGIQYDKGCGIVTVLWDDATVQQIPPCKDGIRMVSSILRAVQRKETEVAS